MSGQSVKSGNPKTGRNPLSPVELKATIDKLYNRFVEETSKGTTTHFSEAIDEITKAILDEADQTPDPVFAVRVFQQHLWKNAVSAKHYLIALSQPMENIDRRCFHQGEMLLRDPKKEVPEILRINKSLKAQIKELERTNTLYGLGGALAAASLQLGLIAASTCMSWGAGLVMALTVGSLVASNVQLRIHDSSHDTEASCYYLNRLIGVICDFFAPTPGETFRFAQDHHYHHIKLGQPGIAGEKDNDLLSPDLAAWVGTSTTRKALLVLTFPILFGIDQGGLTMPESPTACAEAAAKVAFVSALAYLGGPKAFAYWFLSGLWAQSGNVLTSAHWTQEHGTSRPMWKLQENLDLQYAKIPLCPKRDRNQLGWSEVPAIQETSSFYPESFFKRITDAIGLHQSWAHLLGLWYDSLVHRNVNYHVEHHLFSKIPSHKLPELRALLEPYFAGHIAHELGSDDCWDFITNSERTATFRTVRSNIVGRWWRQHINTDLVMSTTDKFDSHSTAM